MNTLKRLFDVCFSLAVLVLGAPLLLLIALIIRCTSPGPIFYGGLRYGKGHKVFKCWKFRTMTVDADTQLQPILEGDPEVKEEWNRIRKIRNDPRIYPFGRILRKYSLDEFPQFWNVLLGDLSVVGPRAYLLSEIDEKLGERAKKILACKPGITGIWQTSGRNLLPFEKRIELDASYADRQSFLFDLKIIAKTIHLFFRPKGAY